MERGVCGVTALFRPDAGPIDPGLLRRMTDAIAHRGPDGEGFYLAPGIGLGHRRLAIIDVDGGHQPMSTPNGGCVIVFNGEIYNFLQLQRRLEARGRVFRTRCDTETILHAWAEFGPDCLAELDGMFAFVLWDTRQRVLFAARDRLGKKPLHYAQTPHGLAFGSEIAALAALPGVARALDPVAVDDFLAYGYVPDPGCIFAGISKLPAAHYLLLRQGEPAAARPVRYWQLAAATVPIGEADAVAGLRARIRDATEARLMADVPLGAFLSGGVDSGGIVAAAAGLRRERGEQPLDTFTMGFAGAEDETPYARQVAARYGTVQHEAFMTPGDVIDAAGRQGAIFGEPFGDTSAVPSFDICALARRHVTVALSGDGGDEVFAGYRRYRWHMLVAGMRQYLPASVRRRVIGGLARVYPKLDRAPRWLRAKYTLTELSLDAALGYYRTMAKVHHDQRRALLAPALRAGLAGHDPGARIATLMDESGTDDALAQAQYADVNTWLVGDILTKVDRTSMANSLEARAPLLDHRLVAFGVSLPAALKLRGGSGKYVLKQAFAPDLPEALLHRPKQGFATALAVPLRAGADRLRARLLGPAMQQCGLFDPAAIGRLIDAHAAGADHAQALWLLLVFEGFLTGAGERAPDGRLELAA
jgi:asparagine synthase (glutamine-hydrolysing)